MTNWYLIRRLHLLFNKAGQEHRYRIIDVLGDQIDALSSAGFCTGWYATAIVQYAVGNYEAAAASIVNTFTTERRAAEADMLTLFGGHNDR